MQDFKTEGPMQTVFRRIHPGVTNLSLLFFKQLFRLRIFHSSQSYLVAQLVNNPPAMQETWIWSLGQEDPLEKEMGIARKWLLEGNEISFSRNSWERKIKKNPKSEKPTPVFLPGEFHGQRSLVGYSWWDRRVRQDWGTDTFAFIVHRVQV